MENLLVTNREGAERVFHAIGMTLHAGKIRRFQRPGRNGALRDYIAVPFSTAQDNEVLNGVRYPAEVLADALFSFEGASVPYDHPADSQGRFVPAKSNIGLADGYMGGHMENVRREDVEGLPGIKKIKGDMVFDLAKMLAEDYGKETMARFEKGDPIETSTGLFTDMVPLGAEEPDGAKFVSAAAVCDHNAILPPGVEPASPIEVSGVFVNRMGGEEHTLRTFTCHIGGTPPVPSIHPDDRLPVSELPEAARNGLLTFLEGCGIPGLMKRREGATNRNSDKQEVPKMTDSVTTPEATPVANAVTEERLTQALAANNEQMLEKFGEMLKPVVDATNAQTEAAKADADAKRAAAVETITNAGAYTEEELKGVPQPMLDKLAANAAAPKDGAQAINATGDGGAQKTTMRNSFAVKQEG